MRELLLIFQDVEDPRRGNAKRHDLHELLVVALVTVLAGGRTCVDMEDFGSVREPWLRQFLTLENGIPSHDTFSRLFRLVDPGHLQTALLRLAQNWADALGDVVAVDGKALRRSFEDASERSPTHLLQAFASEAKLTLAQVKVDGKSNEIPALPELLDLVDVGGRTVTADACTRSAARRRRSWSWPPQCHIYLIRHTPRKKEGVRQIWSVVAQIVLPSGGESGDAGIMKWAVVWGTKRKPWCRTMARAMLFMAASRLLR